jgi:cytoskeleton protein RodZ
MDKKTPQLFADNQNFTGYAGQYSNAYTEPQFENTSGLRDKPDGILNPAGEAGWYLEVERIERGLTLDDISEATGIHAFHIEAIEHGDLTRMPARLEALEMIAHYAQVLGFAPEPLLEHYAAFLPAPHVAPRSHPANPAPLSSAKVLPFGKIIPRLPRFDVGAMKLPSMPSFPAHPGIVASVAGFLMLFGGTIFMFSQADAPTGEVIAAVEQVDPMPTATTGLENADVKVSETPILGEPIAEVAAVDAKQVAPEDPDAMGAFINQLDGDETTASTKPIKKGKQAKVSKDNIEITPNGRVFGANNEESRITLTAKAPVWVSVDDATGKSLMTQMLNQGDSYRVPDKSGLVVLTRDGGRLGFSIDGVEKGLIGTPGEIITGNPLDIEKLLAKG